MNDGYIYLIRAGNTNRYKIGFTTLEPTQRLNRLQTGSPFRLKLICFFKGTIDDETALHRLFENNGCGGEWFEFKSLTKVLAQFKQPAPVDWKIIKREEWNRDAVAINIGSQVMAWGRGISLKQARQTVVRNRKPKDFWYTVIDRLQLPTDVKPDPLTVEQMTEIIHWRSNQ